MNETPVLDAYGMTDVGRKRSRNEDQFLIAELHRQMTVNQSSLALPDHLRLGAPNRGHLLLVADGVGGLSGGDVASATVAEEMARYALNTLPWFGEFGSGEPAMVEDGFRAALQRSESALRRLQARGDPASMMATTLTLAYLLGGRIWIEHVGDSRAYLLRQERLTQLTTDHTVAETMVREGRLSRRNVSLSRWSHVLWNAVGSAEPLHPEFCSFELQPGDSILLCSDGLTRHLTDSHIAVALQSAADARAACHELVRRANELGGEDNITVVVAHLFGTIDPLEAPAADAAAAARESEAPVESGPSPAAGASTPCVVARADAAVPIPAAR